ncbi:hypothetical protein OEZ85_011172 [Tetradesmus obliquus]|uniref:TATA box binding protein associated factor (TAF) histone-like fold domain-containing protein n=1 Tax=Tetradesmus obliquus TaxID=3088 RepID=A0ABY8TRJ7_TETOB|nr:hypothetical protein OEZ85_011172 [Tetradesmus obliquus]
MSIIHPNTIKAIAQSVDIPKLSDEAAQTLAPDVEYRLREVVQEALKFAKHAKRTKLTTEDINDALRLRNVEPLYGFGSRDPAKFLRVATHPELMYVRDPELSYHELIEAPLPKLPREAGVAVHWLAVNGVQPDLPENTPLEQPPPKRQKIGSRQGGAAGQEGLPGAGAAAGADSHLTAPGLAAAAAASGSGAAANAAAAAAAGGAGAGHRNLPGAHPLEDHWRLRRRAAALLASICAAFAAPHHNLAPRLCRVLAGAWLDPGKSLSSKYGAVVGLQALGPQVVRTLLIPHLEPFMSASLFPAMADEPAAAAAAADSDKPLPDGSSSTQEQQQKQLQEQQQKELQEQQQKQLQEQQQRREAWQVYGALLSAAGSAMYDLLIGQLQGQLPMHLLLARRSRPDMEWESNPLCQQVLKAVRGPGVGQGVVQQGNGQQQQQQAVDGGGAAVDAAADGSGAGGVNGRIASTGGQDAAAAAAGAPSSGGQPQQQQQQQQRPLVGGGPAAAAARKRAAAGSSSCSQQQQQPSIAEVLGDAWKEDSDVNATLGALLHLFGEDLLASLPLPQLAAVSI